MPTAADLTAFTDPIALTRKERRHLTRFGTIVDIAADTLVCRQGEVPREVLLVLSGEGEVLRNGTRIANVGAGDIIGELALTEGVPYRVADVVSTTPMVVAAMSAREFASARASSAGFDAHVVRTSTARHAALY